MRLQPLAKINPKLREDCWVFMMKNDAVKKWTNCVSFATLDPFACMVRGALNRENVIPQILKTPEVRKPRDLDIVAWYDDLDAPDGSYHFAVVDKDRYIMQMGRGKPFASASIERDHDDITAKFQHFKRMHRFNLPVQSRAKKVREAVKLFYKALYGRKFDALLKLFEDFDKNMSPKLKAAA